jgi:hypothetical protein
MRRSTRFTPHDGPKNLGRAAGRAHRLHALPGQPRNEFDPFTLADEPDELLNCGYVRMPAGR